MIAGTGALLAGGLLAAPKVLARGRVETPQYSVVASHDAFEVRRYEPRLVAEVAVDGSPDQATNAGFRVLANFIFGNNSARTEVAMTAPVDRTPAQGETIAMTAPVDRRAEGEAWIVAFTMPSQYTLETLPKPNDPRIHIRTIPSTDYAVARFSGAPSEAKVQRRIEELLQAVSDEGLTPSGAAPTYARYDPPWTPGFMRRNEIFIELAPTQE
jgi:effector-binding domain-containing protein